MNLFYIQEDSVKIRTNKCFPGAFYILLKSLAPAGTLLKAYLDSLSSVFNLSSFTLSVFMVIRNGLFIAIGVAGSYSED